MRRFGSTLFFTGIFLIASLNWGLAQTTREDFTDGFYIMKWNNSVQRVYVDLSETGVGCYSVQYLNGQNSVDTTDKISFSHLIDTVCYSKAIFHKHSFDFDFMTIPLKLRPAQRDVPAQLNTHLNGAFYVGYRNDRFTLRYHVDPLKRSTQSINHFGVSVGLFSGVGGTFVSPTTTDFKIDKEYDGVVWCNGVAAFVAMNRFTMGLAFGIDYLTDKNRTLWIYQNKPWAALAFGLNLN